MFGRKLVPHRYDAFRLHVSSSYRELFDRALGRVLQSRSWEMVPHSRTAERRLGRGDQRSGRRARLVGILYAGAPNA